MDTTVRTAFDRMPSRSPGARGRAPLGLGLALSLGCAVLSTSASAGGLFEAMRDAMSGGFTEVRPSYAALPREPGHGGYPGRREMPRDWTPMGAGFLERGLAARATRRPVSGPMTRRTVPGFRVVGVGTNVGRTSGGGQTMCVRLCDGYAFPVGRLASRADIPAHQAACASSCPGAATALYTSSKRSLDPASARSVADGTPYLQLATAFLFRKEIKASCSCQGPDNVAALTPILRDPTLRRGDVVVDPNGDAKVFSGEPGATHTADAFRDVRGSKVLSSKAQGQIDAIMGVAQREATARAFARAQRVASGEPPRPAAATRPAEPSRIREASLRPVAAPAGSAANVRAFTVLSAQPGVGSIRVVGSPMEPRIYVIR